MNKKTSKPRIALIKQTTAPDLYTRTSGSIRQILASSLLRTGPIELLASYNADLYVVDVPYGLACKAWKESIFLGESTLKKLKKQKKNSTSAQIRSNTTPMNAIPWDQYDIVISLSISIPPRLVKKHPEILWCYYIIDPNLTFFLSKKYFPFFRYNVFLDQNLPEETLSPRIKQRFLRYGKTSIHFPYCMFDSRTFTSFFSVRKKRGCKIESRSMRFTDPETLLRLKEFGPISRPVPGLTGYLAGLAKRKYFIIMPDTNGLFRGNSLIEASAAGCLVLAPADVRVINRQLIPKGCFYKDKNDLIRMIKKFEADDHAYQKELNRQQLLNRKYANTLPHENLVALWRLFRQHPATRSTRIRSRMIDTVLYVLYTVNYLLLIRLYKCARILLKPFSKKGPEAIIRNLFNRHGKNF